MVLETHGWCEEDSKANPAWRGSWSSRSLWSQHALSANGLRESRQSALRRDLQRKAEDCKLVHTHVTAPPTLDASQRPMSAWRKTKGAAIEKSCSI